MTKIWANRTLLDRLLIASDGQHVGMVDDLELSDPNDGVPEVTALLSGPTALGPRIGDRIGTWWLAIGRRLRPTSTAYPNRLPVETVREIRENGIHLAVAAGDAGTGRFESWLRDEVISQIPGGGSESH
jgi:hypothetical protein